jgi:acetyltransferase-like isoleucine patch superfamily enzyme
MRRVRSALHALRLIAALSESEREGLRRLAAHAAEESVDPARSLTIDTAAVISPLASLRFTERVEIGPRANIGPFCVVWGGWSETWARVGAGALLSPGAVLVAGNHAIERPGWVRDTGFDERDVTVGEGAWLGAHAVVVGCRVGNEAVVGAGAVVLEDVPDGAIAVGVPARVIGQRPRE